MPGVALRQSHDAKSRVGSRLSCMFGVGNQSLSLKGLGMASAVAGLVLCVCCGLGSIVLYLNNTWGTTDGPDFIQAIQAPSFDSASVQSIEVVDPSPTAHPFTLSEYASLRRRCVIRSRPQIDAILSSL